MTEHVVALSGGADSSAMSLRLRELYPERRFHFFCTPTRDELPEMEVHWARLEELLGQKLVRVNTKGLLETSRAMNILPSLRMRWCTRILKIEPCIAWLRQFDEKPLLYVGLRADEETRDGLYSDDVETVCPMREWGWTRKDVLDYLKEKRVKVPRRTDCALCPAQRLAEWYELWRDYPEQWNAGEELEAAISEARDNELTMRSASRDTWPASMKGLRERFERGYIPRGVDNQFSFDFVDDERLGACRVCTL